MPLHGFEATKEFTLLRNALDNRYLCPALLINSFMLRYCLNNGFSLKNTYITKTIVIKLMTSTKLNEEYDFSFKNSDNIHDFKNKVIDCMQSVIVIMISISLIVHYKPPV